MHIKLVATVPGSLCVICKHKLLRLNVAVKHFHSPNGDDAWDKGCGGGNGKEGKQREYIDQYYYYLFVLIILREWGKVTGLITASQEPC